MNANKKKFIYSGVGILAIAVVAVALVLGGGMFGPSADELAMKADIIALEEGVSLDEATNLAGMADYSVQQIVCSGPTLSTTDINRKGSVTLRYLYKGRITNTQTFYDECVRGKTNQLSEVYCKSSSAKTNVIRNCQYGCEDGACNPAQTGWNSCQKNTGCQQYHSCINNRCMLDNTNYKLGLVYIYYNQDTYNPNWRKDFEAINRKVISGIKESTSNKVNPTIDILGEVKTDIFCWNPATVGGKLTYFYGGKAYEQYVKMPGSEFAITELSLSEGQKIAESYCNNCILDVNGFRIKCENNLNYYNLFQTDKRNQLYQQISQKLGFSFNDYDGVFIIFGKLGQVLPDESNVTLTYRCSNGAGIIGGFSSLLMGENAIKTGGLIKCDKIRGGGLPYYDKTGWHIMVHEILHRFGAVDVYNTGTAFGIKSERDKALEIDPKANESIMGDQWRNCMENGVFEKDGRICTQKELEMIYVDKYNKQKIGIDS